MAPWCTRPHTSALGRNRRARRHDGQRSRGRDDRRRILVVAPRGALVLGMSVDRLAELLRSRRPCVVLTGAGISTESGIPDFRSAEGIWAQYDPAEVAHIDAFRRDPARVWEFYALRLDALAQAEPNDGHRALAELEERGWIRAVVTQNVDGLHQRAGSREVVEVHGSLREAECIHCGVRVPMKDAVASLPLPS